MEVPVTGATNDPTHSFCLRIRSVAGCVLQFSELDPRPLLEAYPRRGLTDVMPTIDHLLTCLTSSPFQSCW